MEMEGDIDRVVKGRVGTGWGILILYSGCLVSTSLLMQTESPAYPGVYYMQTRVGNKNKKRFPLNNHIQKGVGDTLEREIYSELLNYQK